MLRTLIAGLVGVVSLVIPGLMSQVQAAAQFGALASIQSLPIEQRERRAPERYQGSARALSAAAMLAEQGVILDAQDKVTAFPPPELGVGSTLEVFRAQRVTVADGSASRSFTTWASSVGDVLAEQRISLNRSDTITPPLGVSAQLAADQVLTIKITRITFGEAIESEPIEFLHKTIEDPTLERGKKRVDQEGITGILERHFTITVENGQEVSRVLSREVVAQAAQNEVIAIGTKPVLLAEGTGQASWYGGVPAYTAAHKTLKMGTRVRVTNTVSGKSVVVTINDRGPFVAGRIIDLDPISFAEIAPLGAGVASVRIEAE